MVSGNKKRFHEDQEIYLQMLRDANLSVTAIREYLFHIYPITFQVKGSQAVARHNFKRL